MIIIITSIICYAYLIFFWNGLESFNPPIEMRKIQLMNNHFFDLFGAIIPIIFSSAFLFYLLSKKIIKFIKFVFFMFTLALSVKLFFTSYDGAVMINWLNVILFSSLISTIMVIKNQNINENPVSYFQSINIFLLGYCLSTFSILLVDLGFALFSTESYIGAAGIVDAIFLSSVFTFIPTFFWLSLFNILNIDTRSSLFNFF